MSIKKSNNQPFIRRLIIMAIIKGFAIVPVISNNNNFATSAIGELTNREMTFSKDRKVYTTDALSTDTMVFSTKDDAGAEVGISDVDGDSIARVPDYIVKYALDNPGPTNENALITLLNDDFTADFISFSFGDLVNEGTTYVPSWVAFQSANGDHEIKIWFSKEAFSNQYDEFEIIVVPRIPNVGNFNVSSVADLNIQIDAVSDYYMLDRVIDITSQDTQTYIEKKSFTWVSRLDPANTQEVPFTYVVYGNGVDLDKIKEATVAVLVASTGGDDTIWRQVFPELFGANEYIIVPHWDKYSVPNASPSSSLYSPIFVDGDNVEYASIVHGQLNLDHISNNARTTVSMYRGLAFTIYPNENNIGGAIPFDSAYPDYFHISTSSTEFSWMADNTMSFARTLERLVVSAETLGPNSSLESGVSFRTVAGKKFAVASSDDGNTFLMLSKDDVVNR